MNKNSPLLVAEQSYLPLSLPEVHGNQDYRNFKQILKHLNHLLLKAGIEKECQEYFVSQAQSLKERRKGLSVKETLRVQQQSSRALRCNLARVLTGQSFRGFALRLADSYLLQDFCRLQAFNKVKIPSKSTLQEYSEMFEESKLRTICQKLMSCVGPKEANKVLGLKKGLDLSVGLMDSTCVKLNIHYPVDWVLLRDATRTLMKAVACIRRHGLRIRMKDPQEFISQMNGYCIAMAGAKKGDKARKKKKEILRLMKKLIKCVKGHAERYRALLIERCEEVTDLSEKQSAQIIKRINHVLSQLPQAIKQAHERLIGERQVANADKTLSLYEPQAQVYYRGKSGEATEFGLQLHLAESMDGLMMDWDLVEGAPKKDSTHLKPCLQRLQASGILIKHAVGDRGYPSRANSAYLKEQSIENHLCPKNVIKLQERLKDKAFARFQKRRAQTEARIGILKNNFIGLKMPMKGITRQKQHTAWCVLTHNLWVLARILQSQQEPLKARSLKKAA